ncbi:hypothetical protein M8J75_001079 [Diaphorina citri]|nr:hypothetical protein M8J75_001079 [Diaphorina citri]
MSSAKLPEPACPSEVSERPIAVVIWFCLTSKNAAWKGLILVKTLLLLLLFLLLLLLFLLLLLLFLFLLLLLLFLFLLLLLLFLFLLLLLLFLLLLLLFLFLLLLLLFLLLLLLFLLLLLLFLFLLLLLKGYNYTNVDTYVHSSLAHQVIFNNPTLVIPGAFNNVFLEQSASKRGVIGGENSSAHLLSSTTQMLMHN